jgi:hypothetical protein
VGGLRLNDHLSRSRLLVRVILRRALAQMRSRACAPLALHCSLHQYATACVLSLNPETFSQKNAHRVSCFQPAKCMCALQRKKLASLRFTTSCVSHSGNCTAGMSSLGALTSLRSLKFDLALGCQLPDKALLQLARLRLTRLSLPALCNVRLRCVSCCTDNPSPIILRQNSIDCLQRAEVCCKDDRGCSVTGCQWASTMQYSSAECWRRAC